MKALEAIEKMKCVIRRQHKSLATEESYCGWLRRYMAFLNSSKVAGMPNIEKKLEAFLTHLARDCDVSASTQNQAFNAIIYFYKDVLGTPLQGINALRASRASQMRHAPTLGETHRLLNAVPNLGGYATNLVARLLYGSGLRVGEPVALRVKDVRLED